MVSKSRGRHLAREDAPIAIAVGARIRTERKARGFTQSQIAEPRYTKAYISALESGHAKPSLAALFYIDDGLGVSVHALIPDEEIP